MFAGRRRRSSNIRVMQLFHELKQQFPTVPDHVVSACISTHAQSSSSSSTNQTHKIREILEAAAALSQQQEPMGRFAQPQPVATSPTPFLANPSYPVDETNNPRQHQQQQHQEEEIDRNRFDMNDSDLAENESDFNKNSVKRQNCVTFSKKFESVSVCEATNTQVRTGNSRFYVKRPDHLDIKPETNKFSFNEQTTSTTTRSHTTQQQHNIQLSEKCKDVHKLLHSDNVSEKPPRSPLTTKRLTKNSPTKCEQTRSPDLANRLPPDEPKKTTASTPTQTTDTLLGGNTSPSVNLSVNVNCSMDVVQSPTRRSTVLQVTPQQPWLQQEPSSPRSYTSVNLTLRPPSSEPQPPIDITSRNSSLTYSTSSFDCQKGLQSRLQITVGPGGSGSVSSVRTRPRSSYHPQGGELDDVLVPVRQAGSLNNLAVSSEPPVILKQEARLERLRIELQTDKVKLQVMQKEIAELEGNQQHAVEQKIDDEFEKQLRREIKHLQYQCEHLAKEADKSTDEDFYQNIYTGQRGSLSLEFPATRATSEGWNCNLCTFLNHPDLDECEQCQNRIVHVSAAPGDNIHIHVTPRLSRRIVHSWVL